jgi:ABC-2 type transport system permease protein
MFYGVYIIWDKKLDFLKGVMVAPLKRSTIFAGKVAGGISDALLQATILMLFAPIFGIAFSWNFIPVYLFLLLMVFGTVSMGLFFGSIIESPEAFGLINSIINFPLFFLSGALFPLSNLPSWLAFFTRINPITYGVDAIRQLMLGIGTFSLLTDFIVLAIYGIIMFIVGTYAFRKMKI